LQKVDITRHTLDAVCLGCWSNNVVTKNLQPPTKKIFFIANYKTCWVFWAFEQFSSAFGTRVTIFS